jgi:penicillin-binding protein 2
MDQLVDQDFIRRRIQLIGAIMIVFFLVFFISFWYLQIVRGPYYEQLAGENIFKDSPLPAPRGLIVDRNNHLLAENRLSHNLLLTPGFSKNLKNTLQFLSNVLSTPPEELIRAIKKEGTLKSMRPVLIYQDLSLPQLAYISARASEYPEIDIAHEQKRSYSYGPLFSHAIGYVGEITDAQEKANEFPGALRREIVGQAGIERFYNNYLMGKAGYERKIVNSYGAELKEFHPERLPPTPGKVLRLSLDLNMQKSAQEAFLEGDRYGAAVAMDIRTGEILVLYNRPFFDPNDFVPKIAPQKWKELISDEKHPLQNRTIQNKFSPGSTFKLVMALAALQEKKITPQTMFHCSGSQFIYNRTFRCWKPGGHGTVDLHKALMQSCDVYFYNVGMRLDIDVIAKYARLLGLGALSGIDLPNEARGLVPDRAWKRQTAGDKWYPGETISVAIGQGPILLTALQNMSVAATVASDGVHTSPHLLNAILDFNGKVTQLPTIQKKQVVGIDQRNYELVKKGLWAVVNEFGTGGKARIDGYDVCGKTGTVQVVGFDRGKDLWKKDKKKYGDHAWFVAFAPLENPMVAAAVFVEHGGHGSDAAAPVAKKIFETFFKDRKVPPPSPQKIKVVKAPVARPAEEPDNPPAEQVD